MKKLAYPLVKRDVINLRAGDNVLFTGRLYTARDQAHKRFIELINRNRALPVEVRNQIIYYCGPTATPKGKIIGSCGPTTSLRMDSFLGPLLGRGLLGMIGKGRRSGRARELIKKYKAVYFLAPAGCGALIANTVKRKKLIAFDDLGAEAVLELEVEEFPLIVGIDSRGKSVYEDA